MRYAELEIAFGRAEAEKYFTKDDSSVKCVDGGPHRRNGACRCLGICTANTVAGKDAMLVKASTAWFQVGVSHSRLQGGQTPVIDEYGVHHLIYSMHSSYNELLSVVSAFRPTQIHSITGVSGSVAEPQYAKKQAAYDAGMISMRRYCRDEIAEDVPGRTPSKRTWSGVCNQQELNAVKLAIKGEGGGAVKILVEEKEGEEGEEEEEEEEVLLVEVADKSKKKDDPGERLFAIILGYDKTAKKMDYYNDLDATWDIDGMEQDLSIKKKKHASRAKKRARKGAELVASSQNKHVEVQICHSTKKDEATPHPVAEKITPPIDKRYSWRSKARKMEARDAISIVAEENCSSLRTPLFAHSNSNVNGLAAGIQAVSRKAKQASRPSDVDMSSQSDTESQVTTLGSQPLSLNQVTTLGSLSQTLDRHHDGENQIQDSPDVLVNGVMSTQKDPHRTSYPDAVTALLPRGTSVSSTSEKELYLTEFALCAPPKEITGHAARMKKTWSTEVLFFSACSSHV